MNKISIINKFTKDMYKSYPFPFFEIKNAYDEKIYAQLSKDYDLFHTFFKNDKRYVENNIRLQISSKEFFDTNLFKNSIWHDFISYHSSKEFFLELFEIFYIDIEKIYPEIIEIVQNEKDNPNFLSLRDHKTNENYNFVSDCQPGINTPSKFTSSVRDSHVDNPVELLAGLFYLKDDEDTAGGGDLEIMENTKKQPLIFHNKAEVYNKKDLKVHKLVKYQKNNVIFFLNKVNSVNRVTPREQSNIPRNLTNIIFETYKMKNKLYEINYKKNWLDLNILKKIGKNFVKT